MYQRNPCPMNDRRKVLFTATIDGHIRVFHQPYLRWFKEEGFEVHVAAAGEQDIAYCDVRHQVGFERTPFSLGNLRAYSALARIISQEGFQLVHCHTPTASVLTRLAARKARRRGTRVVYTAHGFHFFQGASFRQWAMFAPVELYLARYADVIVTINDEDYVWARNWIGHRSRVERCDGVGIDMGAFAPPSATRASGYRKQLGYEDSEFVVLYAAELSRRKNQPMLLRAFSHLIKRVPNARLVLAGHGDWESLREQAIRLGVADHVRYLGFRRDIRDVLQVCDAAVSSSYQEGLPVNVIEAMACGVPVVVTDVRGNCDLVESGVNGYVVDSDDDASMAEALFKLASAPDLRHALGAKGREMAERYSIEHSLERMSEIYTETLAL